MLSRFTRALLTLVLPLWLHASLYEALKTVPYPYTVKNNAQPLLTQTDPFHTSLSEHWMTSLLQKEFQDYDPALDKDYVVEKINVNKAMSAEARALTEDTLYTQGALIAGVFVLVLLPESVSNWDLDKLQEKSLGERWVEHVTTKPVWDKDDWAINYIGHPISGAVYYTMARNDGLDIFESALFSTVMSSLFWEYGYEAFAEIPSIQDLIVTPLFGSILGEGMHILEGKLDANQGMIWGSKGLGSFSYFWLDPMGNIAGGLSEMLGLSVTMEFANFPHYNDPSQFRPTNDQGDPVRFEDRDYGVMLTFY